MYTQGFNTTFLVILYIQLPLGRYENGAEFLRPDALPDAKQENNFRPIHATTELNGSEQNWVSSECNCQLSVQISSDC